MKKLKLTKFLAVLLIVASVLVLDKMGVISKWKSNSRVWQYAEAYLREVGQELTDKISYYYNSDGNDQKSSETATSDVPASKEDSSIEYIGQKILDNISVENPSFDVEYKGDIKNSGKDIENIIEKLKYTNPYEAYNISSYNIQSSSYVGSSTVKVKVDCVYKMTKKMETDLDAKAKAIVAQIAPNSMNESKKELAIHDWIVNNTRYDQSHTIYDPYNTLIKHTGVCEGYSLLAQKMFTIAGIKSIIVEGIAGGEPHSWNKVYIGNKWQNVDVTWDDPVSSKDILRHDYFNITDRKLSADHTWDTSKYPRCE